MPNPMMQMLQRSGKSPNNPLAMLGEFRRFAAGQKAKEQVEEMLKSGKMSQEQFQQLQQKAKEFMQFLK